MNFSDEQKKVIDSRGKDLLVSAAAGSGKTAVLIERIVSLITDKEHPADLDRLLVVTFTRAAAGEMKERLSKRLEEMMEADPEDENLRKQSVLIHNAQINTIHSFCSYVIRNYFYKLDIDPAFRVMEDGERKLMISDVMNDLIEDKYTQGAPEFTDFVDTYFTGKDDSRLENVIAAVFETACASPWPDEWYAMARERYSDEAIERDAESEEDRRQLRMCANHAYVICDLGEEFAGRFESVKREKAVLDFSDLEHLTLSILYDRTEDGRHVRSAEARELAEHFRYIMTDEYQDSNLVQESILHAVSRDEDGDHNRFMVGDVKQSIYGFRLADPEIFNEKYVNYAEETDEHLRVDLHMNYRSRKEVVDTVNLVFRRLMIPEMGGLDYDDAAALKYGADYPAEEQPPERCTEFILMDKKDPSLAEYTSRTALTRLEAELAAERIKETVGKLPVYDKDTKTLRPCRYSDIAVLFRSVSGVSEKYMDIFKSYGIPAHCLSRTGYYSATEVVWVMNYLRILDNLHQDIPLAAILFSPATGLTAEELAEIRIFEKADGSDQGDFCSACFKYLESGPDNDTKRKLSEFFRTYRELREEVPYLPVSELIEKLYKATDYRNFAAAMPAGEQRAANLDMLVKKAATFEETSYHGLFNFIRYIEKLEKYDLDEGEANILSETADAVRLMTIHKSKGLEFPVVFLCDTSHGFNNRDLNDTFLFHSKLGIGMTVCDPRRHLKLKSESCIRKNAVRSAKKQELYSEYLRLLYVAMTRARERLFITGISADAEKLEKEFGAGKRSSSGRAEKADILKAKNLLEMIYLALAGENYDFVRVHTETAGSLAGSIADAEKTGLDLLAQISGLDGSAVYDGKVKALLDEAEGYAYPYDNLRGMPGKMTVSQLKVLPDDPDADDIASEVFVKKETPVPYVPEFISESRETGLTGAERGTVYHRVFELLDYGRFAEILNGDGSEDEQPGADFGMFLKELTEAGMLTEKEASCVDPEAFICFLNSHIGKRMAAAALRGELKREQPFTFSIPADEVNESWPEDQALLIQGIIDAFFMESGEYVIVDYKTDQVPDGREGYLVDKYAKQLYYYAKALEAATGVKVREKIIYSTSLSKEIKVDI